MHDALQCDPGAFPDLARAQARSRRTLTDYIEDLVAEGTLQGDPQVLGHIFWATTHGLLSLQLAGRLDSRPDFDTLYRTAMRMLARGAAPDAAPDDHEKPARQRRRARIARPTTPTHDQAETSYPSRAPTTDSPPP